MLWPGPGKRGTDKNKRFRATQEPGLASNSAQGSSGKSHSIIQGAKKLAILIVCGRIYPPEFALIAKILLRQRRTPMRSDLIYDALNPINNRYLLCQVVSKATRKFHRPATRIQDTMNDVLVRVGSAAEPEAVLAESPAIVAEPQRRAA